MRKRLEDIKEDVNKLWESLGDKQKEFRKEIFTSLHEKIDAAISISKDKGGELEELPGTVIRNGVRYKL